MQRSFSIAPWKGDQPSKRLIYWDVLFYYGYLPATFIHGDPTLSFTEEEKEFEDQVFWKEQTEDGEKVFKGTMGLAYLYAPFFFLAHAFANLSSYEASGFSPPYQFAIAMSAIFYASLGLVILRSMLRSFYGELITGLTLIVLAIGTNLFLYVVMKEGAMAHSYNFAIILFYFHRLIHLFESPSRSNFILIGLLGGLIVLIRPTNLVPVLLLPLLYKVFDQQSIKDRLLFVRQHGGRVLIAIVAAFLVILPQLIYWKGITGQWVYFSYGEEGFFFDRPMFGQVLFGYRTGWLLYTPLMSLALLGFFFLWKRSREGLFWPFLLILAIKIYLISCWWSWWFGGSFGCRPIVDLYGLLAFPLAATLHHIWRKGWSLRVPLLIGLAFFIHMNLYQSWQYKVGIIHHDAMTKEAYWHVFLRKARPTEDMLERPDNEAALIGRSR